MRKLFLILLISISDACYAGWQSGGGELTTDANNPWFLTNTPNVSYCIQVADEGFPYSADSMNTIIREIFNYWRTQFKLTSPTFPQARIATQTFNRETCENHTQIKFQFGFMTDEQLQVIKDASSFIALTVRTDYDAVNLRAKGFVYISAESGKFRPKSEKLIESQWQICGGCRLKRVLAHEMGHIFGIPHTTTMDLDLMAPDTPENMVSKYFTGDTPDQNTPLPPYFVHSFPKPYKICHTDSFPDLFHRAREFFGAQQSASCIHAKLENGDYSISATDAGGSALKLGTIEIHEASGQSIPIVRVRLTPEQKVFPDIAKQMPYVLAASRELRYEFGTYRSVDGIISRNIITKIEPHFFQLGGFLGETPALQIITATNPY